MLNLHQIVRAAINLNFEDEEFTLIRSVGQKNVKGKLTALYEDAGSIKGNFQSEGDSALAHAEYAGQNTTIRKLYIFATEDRSTRPWAIYRPLARTGDYFIDQAGAYWLVVAVEEDFTHAGWESLRVEMQTVTPSLTFAEDEENDSSDTGTSAEDAEGEEQETTEA